MSSARAVEALPDHETRDAQARAADPLASAWVAANAGTGKTYVLVMRVLRLLLSGTPPARILCLTYTKAAAAEMSNRLFERLAEWATCSEPTLAAALHALTGSTPDAILVARARTLFAAAIETPGGLKVQTIHAFCERLLQRFPLEAGVPAGFSVLDEADAAALLSDSIEKVLTAAGSDPALAEALNTMTIHVTGPRFDAVLGEVLQKPERLRRLLAVVDEDGDGDTAALLTQLERRLRQRFGVRPTVSQGDLIAAANACLPPDLLQAALARLPDKELARSLAAARGLDQTSEERLSLLRKYFYNSGNEPRRWLLPVQTQRDFPHLTSQLELAQLDFIKLDAELKALSVAQASAALVVVAGATAQALAEAKAQRTVLTFADLISATARLLQHAPDAHWVQFKIDGGLDHVLVDEAQDTAPEQWAVIGGLVGEFFSGSGARDITRTVFAVGDEKQSIYGFQGAEPRRFVEQGRAFAQAAATAQAPLHRIALTLSFRSVPAILEAVDAVFALPEARDGLTADDIPIHHRANRQGEGGLVELWPLEMAEPRPPEDLFDIAAPDPLDRPAEPPMRRLAARVASHIAGLLSSGELLASQGRPIRPGDIIVLVRRRNPLAPEIIRQLEQRRVPVSGADRLTVSAEIGVEDLISLARVLLLPEDDLALAEVLKSPLFDIDEDQLFRLAHGRKGSLWNAVLEAAKAQPIFFGAAVAQLKRWRSEADYLPPFEFLSNVLDRDGGRQRLLGRLGPEAADALDELLNRALVYDSQSPPSLQGFVVWLMASATEIKRDMDQARDEVRVLTVHAAKGLEAPIVYLPDTCSKVEGRSPSVLELPHAAPSADPVPDLVWLIKGATALAAIDAAKTRATESTKAEHRRLLYVAMTRPRDRLYVGGYQDAKGNVPGECWYRLIEQALTKHPQVQTEERVLRLVSPQLRAVQPAAAARPAGPSLEPLPAWATRPAPRAAAHTIPLAPSRLAPLESEEGTVLVGASDAARLPAGPPVAGDRFRRGVLTHALLQHLPDVPALERDAAAAHYLAVAAADWPASERHRLIDEVRAVLLHEDFAPLFAAESMAEVPVAAVLPTASGNTIRIAGQIDRLHVTPDRVRFIDYKANRSPPTSIEALPRAYLLQAAAYRAVLLRIYPDRPVDAALLWTAGPLFMPLPAALLDAAAQEIASGDGWT